MNSNDVIANDLSYIILNLNHELTKLANNKLLITGGAGFLGYYLVQTISHWNKNNSNKIKLTVYDNFIRGFPNWLKKLGNEDFIDVINYDITQPIDNKNEFDYIIHAAGIASPIAYRKNPIGTMKANVDGLINLLDFCLNKSEKSLPIKGFLYFSTSEIYGDPDDKNIPTSETYRGNVSCTGPRACYDESKRYGETVCINYANQYNLPIKIARPFNNYGPGLKIDDRRVIPDFAKDILSNRDIVLLSNGSPTRTFCYVADAIIGYFKILTIGKQAESYNIGVETPEISMLELAQLMIKKANDLFGYTGKLVFMESDDKDYLKDNPNRRCPNISKARNHLSYNPNVSLDEGIGKSLLWYYDNK